MSSIKAQRYLLSLEVKLGRAGIVLERERNLCGLSKGSEFNSSGLMSYKSVSEGCRSVISTPSLATPPSDRLSASPRSEISASQWNKWYPTSVTCICVSTVKSTYFLHADSLHPRVSSISGPTSARHSTPCQELGKKPIDCMFKLSNTSDLSSFRNHLRKRRQVRLVTWPTFGGQIYSPP